jgi:site-specific DNA-methyltransferase (adenine-specific)
MADHDFREFLFKAFSAAATALRPGAACYVWMGSTEIDAAIEQYEKAGLLYKQLLIWVKNAFTLGRQDYQWRHETCIYGWKPGSHYFIDSRKETTVTEDRPDIEKMSKAEAKQLLKTIFDEQAISTTAMRYDKPVKDTEHPTMKPIPMIGRQIRNSSRRGDIVLDTFGGSGTTLIACDQLGRKCRIMELDPHYCDVIIARWEKLTGLKAQKLN